MPGIETTSTKELSMANQLGEIQHIVVLMLENRSFDHMLGFLYADQQNQSPSGQPFDGLTGNESNPASNGEAVKVYAIQASDSNAYFQPAADPGEGYSATNSQLFGTVAAPSPPVATNQGFVTDYAYTLGWESKKPSWSVLPDTVASDIMGMFTPDMLPVLSGLARGYAVCDQCRPRPCRIARSCARRPVRGTWTTTPKPIPRRASSA
jgi:phospholipase C